MTPRSRSTALLVAAALLAPAATAQDSVQITPCGPGDAVSPWDDMSTGLFGSEQTNNYVVDLQSLTGSWGTPYGIAPLVKGGKISSMFNSSLISGQTISRRQQVGVPTHAASYAAWSAPGFGVNNNPAINMAPGTVSTPVSTNQFTVAFNDGGQTDLATFYDGVVGAVVNFVPSSPGRLFVSRTQVASNSCAPFANMGSMGLGSADEDGNIFIRYDDFGSTGGCGPLPPGGASNILSVDVTARDASVQNVFSGMPMTFADAAATSTYVFGAGTVHATPSNIPESIAGAPTFGTLTFGTEYAFGTAGSVSTTGGHLNAANGDSRGNLGYMSANFGPLGSSGGVYGHIGVSNASGDTDELNIFGVNTSGAVTGTTHATLPASITDPKTGFATFTDPGGEAEFDHYHSQVPFQGSNGNVALGVDQDGNMLAAAVFDHPIDGGTTHPINAVGVAKFDGTTGAFMGWTLAGYNDGGLGGKPVLDGPGGSALYRMVTLSLVTGGTVIGPSISAPMMDSVGNVYFLTALQEVSTGDFSVGLVRAVYDSVAFGYDLELLFQTGDVFRGKNSDRDYLISFLEIADNNSISSDTAWSGNIMEQAHGAQDPSGLDTSDPRTLGGLVINASIIYDADDDGDFTTCANGGVDEQYNVLLYVGHREWEDVGEGKQRVDLVQPELHISGTMEAGQTASFGFNDAPAGETAFIVIGFGPLFAPFKCQGTMVPTIDVILNVPTFGGDLTLNPAWPAGIPAGVPLHWQVHFSGPSICGNFPSTNGVMSLTY